MRLILSPAMLDYRGLVVLTGILTAKIIKSRIKQEIKGIFFILKVYFLETHTLKYRKKQFHAHILNTIYTEYNILLCAIYAIACNVHICCAYVSTWSYCQAV